MNEMTTYRRARWTTSVVAMLAMAACGNLTPGGFTGEATVRVSGDADTLAAAQQVPVLGTLTETPSAALVTYRDSGPSQSPEEAEGQLQVEFMAYLVNEGGGQTQLGTDELQVQVDLRGRTEADVVDRQMIPAVVYTDLRLVFIEIKAEVEGLVIDGTPVPEVHVELEDVSLEVTRPISLDVQPGTSAELVIDLNALAWLGAVDPLTGGVDESVFADLINVVVE
jgi:hypothetical protein